jgi:hypothetical protein
MPSRSMRCPPPPLPPGSTWDPRRACSAFPGDTGRGAVSDARPRQRAHPKIWRTVLLAANLSVALAESPDIGAILPYPVQSIKRIIYVKSIGTFDQ